MEKRPAVQPYDGTALIRSWTSDEHDCAVILVDETKGLPRLKDKTNRSPVHRLDNVIIFHGILAAAKSVASLICDLRQIRQGLSAGEENRSFKSSDFWRTCASQDSSPKGWEVVPDYRAFVARLVDFYREVPMVYCAGTTDRLLKAHPARVSQKIDRSRQVESSGTLTRLHSVPFVTWLKWVANTAGLGCGLVYVVVDGSDDLALKPGTCFRLEDANYGPNGQRTAITCEASFEIFVGSDKEAPLRDALMAPDLLGNLALAKLGATSRGYTEAVQAVLDKKVPLHAWGYPLSKLIDSVTLPTPPVATKPAG